MYPVIQPDHRHWREYYRNRNLNLPHQYHNGGIWPMVGGFYVAALVKAGRAAEAEHQLARLAEANRQGLRREWEFNEFLHGLTGRPLGAVGNAWSAGMYVFAYRAVQAGRVPPPFDALPA
jgi:glycogen debranching enzyme